MGRRERWQIIQVTSQSVLFSLVKYIEHFASDNPVSARLCS